MTAYRRLTSNFALQYALERARAWGKPLMLLEALRSDYRWASDRLHQFVIDGMAEHARALEGSPVRYLPYVERTRGAGKGLLARLAADACLVVTDDFPAFFLPRMVAAAGHRIESRLDIVDSNGILPMRATEKVFLTAHSYRSYVQGAIRDQLSSWPQPIAFDKLPGCPPLAVDVQERWPATPTVLLDDPASLVARLPIDHSVAAVEVRGGTAAARAVLNRFITQRLGRYVEDHSHPDREGTSGLSPYLHFGHLSAHEVFDAVMNAEGFLDQLVTWRELGFNLCARRPADYDQYSSLPSWARGTLEKHATDTRVHRYSRDEFMNAATHDRVWNAAQNELSTSGTCHNYMRMVWGKKILEWTRSPEEALDTMIEVMNRLALDGRDPNSYSGYGWALGRYDRPWGPEREIFGTVRYMSSENTVRKLKMKQYLEKWSRRPRA